jgi:hypothetical protein
MSKKSPIRVEQWVDVFGSIPALLGFFSPNATRIKVSNLFFQLSKEVGHILFLKRGRVFNAFPNLEMKVIKSATHEEICFLICPS